MTEIKLPHMPYRTLEIFFLFIDNYSNPLYGDGILIPYDVFGKVTPPISKRRHIQVKVSEIRPLLAIYGFYITNVANQGFMCHKAIIHRPDKFDRKFHGAESVKMEF